MTETSTPAPNRNKAQIGLSAADVTSSLGENGVTNLD